MQARGPAFTTFWLNHHLTLHVATRKTTRRAYSSTGKPWNSLGDHLNNCFNCCSICCHNWPNLRHAHILIYTAPANLSALTPTQTALIQEHAYGGLPSTENIYIRNGYVLSYNPTARTPHWVAYHVEPEYRDTLPRKGKFSRFRGDPDIEGEAKDSDYKGLFKDRGYARGHLAPYCVMGGDRDNDGLGAEKDPDDAMTVYQGNYLSNIAPQHHKGFNGSPGLWYKLERWIQDELVTKQKKEVWVFAGCIFGPGEHEKVGKNKDIWVPAMFYKIVIIKGDAGQEPKVLAFLFPHQRKAHGDIEDFLVPVEIVEAMSGVDFVRE